MLKRIVLSVCAAVAAAVSAWGDIYTWTGGTGAWDDETHWQVNGVTATQAPGEGDDVLLPAPEDTTGNYSVTAATGSCEATALINIPECELNLYLPKAITPGDHDGLNDVFSIPEWTKNMISDNGFEICIFNRWGEMVFYSTDKNFMWNGEIKGTIYRNNIYNYSLRYRNTTGRKFLQKGSITVL